MKYLKSFNESNIVISDGFSPVIGYEKDIQDGKTSLMDGYYTGTAYIGDESDERQGDVNYSSPFHTGQVTDDGVSGVEEMDFSYSKYIDSGKVRKLLDDHVAKNYNGKIVKVVYH